MRNTEKVPFKELVTAAAETLEYFKLSGAETFLSSSGEGSCPAARIIRAYQAFESVCEYILGKADYLTVRLERSRDIRLRMQLSGENGLPNLTGLTLDGCDVAYSAEESDAELLIRILEGGDGQ